MGTATQDIIHYLSVVHAQTVYSTHHQTKIKIPPPPPPLFKKIFLLHVKQTNKQDPVLYVDEGKLIRLVKDRERIHAFHNFLQLAYARILASDIKLRYIHYISKQPNQSTSWLNSSLQSDTNMIGYDYDTMSLGFGRMKKVMTWRIHF